MPDVGMKTTISVIVGSLILIVGVVMVATIFDRPDQVEVSKTLGDLSGAQTKGKVGAEINIVEFSDFQCPACGVAYVDVKQFINNFGDQVLLTYRNFPLPQHTNARQASYAAEAAGKQDKFWQVHDWLFENQHIWEDVEVDGEYFYRKFGVEVGLDQTRFLQDYSSDEVRNKVATDVADGNQIGVNSTPTFFINGSRMPGVLTYDDLVELSGVEVAEVLEEDSSLDSE